MSLSLVLSKFSRLALLSVFCAGAFVTSGELSINTDGIEITNWGIESAMAKSWTPGDADFVGPPAPAKKDPIDPAINTIISVLNLGIGVLTFLITPLIMLAGWLLSPDWTFGEIFGLRPILHQLWVLVSNVVYVIFGFMLVGVAFANIFGAGWDTYKMRTYLPKLVTGMLIVPFTWFIVSAVLSVSNILTASVISLPMETILKAGGGVGGFLKEKTIPKTIMYYKWADLGTGSKDSGWPSFTTNGEFLASDCKKSPDTCISIEEFLTNGKWWAYNLLSVYAYGIFKIQNYKEITIEEKIKKVIDIASKLSFGIIFFIIFGILVIAIVYALLSRAFMLWMYAIFSPLFALTYVLGDKAKKLEKFTFKEFISLALVPVYVSAALAFWLMFLGLVAWATNDTSSGEKIKSDVVEIETPNGSSTTTFTFGEITLTTIWLLSPEGKSWAGKALDLGKGIIGTIIVNFLALAILWMAVMAAFEASKITEAAVKPIADFGSEIGKLAMKAPQYVPIPLPKGSDGKDRSISMAGLWGITSQIDNALRTNASEQGAKIGKSFAEGLWLKVSELWETLRQTTLSIKWHANNKELQKEDWRKALAGIGDGATLNSQKEVITPQFKEMLQSTTIEPNKKAALEKLLTDGNLPEFIKQFEHYFDASNLKGFTDVSPDQIDAYLKSIKNNSSVSAASLAISRSTANQITIYGETATITPSVAATATTGPVKAKISNTEVVDLLAKLNPTGKPPVITDAELRAKFAAEDIDIK